MLAVHLAETRFVHNELFPQPVKITNAFSEHPMIMCEITHK